MFYNKSKKLLQKAVIYDIIITESNDLNVHYTIPNKILLSIREDFYSEEIIKIYADWSFRFVTVFFIRLWAGFQKI